MFLVVCMLVFGFLCGRMAQRRNRSVAGWAIAGAVFGLIPTLIIACLAPVPTPLNPGDYAPQLTSERRV